METVSTNQYHAACLGPGNSRHRTTIEFFDATFDFSIPNGVHVVVDTTVKALDQPRGQFRAFAIWELKGVVVELSRACVHTPILAEVNRAVTTAWLSFAFTL